MTPSEDPLLKATAEFEVQPEQKETPSPAKGRVRVDCAALSHQGHVRRNNEDHYMVANFGRFLKPLLTNVSGQADTVFAEEGHGMVVADGMGGASAGEVASDLAIRALLNLVYQTPDWIFSRDANLAERVMERMTERYWQIDEILLKQSRAHVGLRGMGTTMTLAGNVADTLVLAHVGDSRAYLYRAGSLHQLTCDHTAAEALVEQGILKHADEAHERLRHALVRFLGGSGGCAEAQVKHLSLADQDTLILCTDGLSDMVDDAAIAAVLAAAAPATETCQALVERALANGGKDNVTVIVARYGFFARSSS